MKHRGSAADEQPPETGAPAHAARQHRANNFNALRLLFSTAVIVSHSYDLVRSDPTAEQREPLRWLSEIATLGTVAVYGFFLLSGGLVVQSWLREPNVIAFLWKRVRRIVPGFAVASLLCALVVAPLATDARAYFAAFHWRSYLVSLLLLRLPDVPATFSGTPYPLVNGSMWTIEQEFKCYLVALLMGIAFRKRRWAWPLLTLVLLGLDVCRWTGWQAELLSPVTAIGAVRLLTDLGVFFGVGACLAVTSFEPSRRAKWMLFICTALSLFERATFHVGLAVGGGILLWSFAQSSSRWLRPLHRMPDISYGIYLYGWPVQKLLTWYAPSLSVASLCAASVAVSALMGALSWYLIESRFIALPLPPVLRAQPVANARTNSMPTT